MHGEDTLVVCPFNPAHKVKEGRLDIHISKCRRECRRSLVNCPYNSGHLVQGDALHQHLASCPDRCSAGQANHQSAGAAEADALYPIKAPSNLPEPEECWDKDADDWEDWRTPAKEPIFRPAPIGARPAERRAYYDVFNDAPRPPGPFRVLQPSGASQSSQETSARSTLEAAADQLTALEDLPQPRASSPVELREYPQPKTTIRFLPALKLPCPDAESDCEGEPVVLAKRLAALGRGRRRRE
ncbi:hypothetical protein HPB48_016771 [Haemaphysalis longicornis]|uniref:CHHC U11-48K-type domain-containing protein n=1 Tax=Haemaphysalis longicornis TaxID=44386 RepID=A0A9J6FIL3_HAELO|nr:hypothetical protein HPB48_016771 [Haemaphysalis longicornis]